MLRLGIYFAALEVLGLLGFITIASIQASALLKSLPLIIILISVGYFAARTTKIFSIRQLFGIAAIASIIFTVSVQFLGFLFYPGLIKDINFLSLENAKNVVIIFGSGLFVHMFLFTLVKLVKFAQR